MLEHVFEKVFDEAIKNYPQVLGYACLAFIVAIIVWWIMKYVTPAKKLAEKIDSLVTKDDIADVRASVSNMQQEVKDMSISFAVVQDRVETIWRDKYAPAHSPRKLNDRGKEILDQSGIKNIIDQHKKDFIEKVRANQPTNAYDAEQMILELANTIPEFYPDTLASLKDGAFKTGTDIDVILFVGGIYLRDSIMDECGFKLDDIDKIKSDTRNSEQPKS